MFSSQCREGLFCDQAAVPAACAPRRAPGEACTSSAACTSNQCNPGTCASTGQGCFVDASCSGQCADDNSACFTDGQCALGTCSGTTTLCATQATCAVGSTCVFPVRCNPGDCVGDIVCADRHLVVDYCQAALNNLPVP
jgi:hypothetical protein